MPRGPGLRARRGDLGRSWRNAGASSCCKSPADTLESGVEATRRLAVDPAQEGTTGQFFDRLRAARPTDQAYDEQASTALRARSLALANGCLTTAH